MFDPGTPHTAPELVAALSRLLGEGMSYQAPRSDAWFFAPQGSAWSPAGHFRHLRKSTTALLNGVRLPHFVLRLRFGMHEGPSRQIGEVRKIYLEKIAAGGMAPAELVAPEETPADPTSRRQEILARWTSVTIELTNRIGSWSEESLDQIQFPHPLLGNLTAREMMGFTVFHTAHHLQRIAERSAPLA